MMTTDTLPVIDLKHFISNPNSIASIEQCRRLAEALKTLGAFAVRDDRVCEQDNSGFLDIMEDYFDQPSSVKMPDVHPEFSYQVGSTPDHIELPRCGSDDDCTEMVAKLHFDHKPSDYSKPDPKWRYFWRMGIPPAITNFKQLNSPPVIPKAFDGWEAKMNFWGNKMLDAVSIVSRMLAIGLNLPIDTFTSMSDHGPHLLAPTGSDLAIYGRLGTVLAGFHSDLNFLTIHGKSRFAGLNIWTNSGTKLLVKIPDGCLLIQAGKQLEYCTAGAIRAGFHEVVVVAKTLEAIERQKDRKRPLWRVSSTLFYHLASDRILEPIGRFKDENSNLMYPSILVGEQVQKELGLLELSTSDVKEISLQQ